MHFDRISSSTPSNYQAPGAETDDTSDSSLVASVAAVAITSSTSPAAPLNFSTRPIFPLPCRFDENPKSYQLTFDPNALTVEAYRGASLGDYEKFYFSKTNCFDRVQVKVDHVQFQNSHILFITPSLTLKIRPFDNNPSNFNTLVSWFQAWDRANDGVRSSAAAAAALPAAATVIAEMRPAALPIPKPAAPVAKEMRPALRPLPYQIPGDCLVNYEPSAYRLRIDVNGCLIMTGKSYGLDSPPQFTYIRHPSLIAPEVVERPVKAIKLLLADGKEFNIRPTSSESNYFSKLLAALLVFATDEGPVEQRPLRIQEAWNNC